MSSKPRFRLSLPAWSRPFIEEPISEDVQVPTVSNFSIYLGCTAVVGLGLQIASAVFCSPLIPAAALWASLLVYLLVIQPRTVGPIAVILLFATCCYQVVAILLHHSSWTTPTQRGLVLSALVPSATAVLIVLNTPLRDPRTPADGISKPFTTPSSTERSPEDNFTLWQWMSVTWMTPMIRVGNQRQLHPEDVWRLPYQFNHRNLHNAFAKLRGSVLRRLLRANWIDLAIISCLSLTELAGKYTSPLIFQQLLLSMQNVAEDKSTPIFWALITLLVRFVITQTAVFTLWYSRRAYERSRGEMITMIYEKTLHRKIQGGVLSEKPKKDEPADVIQSMEDGDHPYDETSHLEAGETNGLLNDVDQRPTPSGSWVTACFDRLRKVRMFWRKEQKEKPVKEPASIGKILNMMRNDAYEVAQRFWEFPDLLNQPLGFALSLALTWRLIGWPCLFGLGVVVVSQAINGLLAKVLVRWETSRRLATDAKLQKISQYIEAIRHLRFYAWQKTWMDRVLTARQKELSQRVFTSVLLSVIMTVSALGSFSMPIATFWAYTTLKGEPLTVDVAFPAIQLFDLLQDNIRALPRLITVLLNASVAVGRIEDFMQEPDKVEEEADGMTFGPHFQTKNASFAWPGTSSPVLKEVSLTFPVGLTVVYGQVAAGKTALLQALLGELDLLSGELVRPEFAVAYCSQTPWLQSMSIRDNILFNSPLEEERYKQVLHACALVPDLASFDHGDLSPIGENGIGLSGGQKMRVALARAMYSHAQFLLLDDPLSALDQQTAEHIVRHCLRGPLSRDRTLILVTHRLDMTRGCADQLVEVTEGVAVPRAHIATDPTEANPSTAWTHESSEDKVTVDDVIPKKFEDEEHRFHGGVQAKVYWEYIKAGRLIFWGAVFAASMFSRFSINFSEYWIKQWAEAYRQESTFLAQVHVSPYSLSANSTTPIDRFFDTLPNPSRNVTPWLVGLTLVSVSSVVFYAFAMTGAISVTYTAGKRLFTRVVEKVSTTEFRFYDVTPSGRLMNRLTSDMGTVDSGIPNTILQTIWEGVTWAQAVVIIGFVTPTFTIAIVALTSAFALIFSRFIATSQSLRRLEMVSLSPLMSNFGALLEGLMTVRAFCAQPQFQDQIFFNTDAFQQMDHFYWSLQAWLAYRFELLSAFSTLGLTGLAIYSGLSPGLTAFVLVSSNRFVGITPELCRSYGTLQLEFVAVERVIEMLHLSSEDPGTLEPPASWPSTKDDVVFEDVTLRYAPHLDPALEELSFTIPGGSSAAVIGRTGSGKSTMAMALLGTTKLSAGRILIGGVDLAKVSKHALRSRITFLAQDPVLFPGSLRQNLDPIEEHTDRECAAVLERVCGTYGFTLDTEVDSGGKNFSQGQRQLVGLARAILRRSTIVIMDEATASIDRKTSWDIQRVLKEELAGSTVITIAHRPSAVRGADLCIKLANGRLEAIGRPEEVAPDDSQHSSVTGRETM